MSIGSADERNFLDYVVGQNILQESIDWISSNLDPDDVFDTDELIEWAESNGYVKGENDE
jgi:hypothetical protein